MNLLGNRADETYTYRRVDWQTWQEGTDLGDVVSGSIELGAFTDLKATCSFSFMGQEAPEQDSLIRIYYSFKDEEGEVAEFMLGTFLIAYSTVTQVEDRLSGTADGYSVLKVLNDRKYGMPFTVNAGELPVSKAVALMEGLGLRVNVGEESSYALQADHTFDPDDSYLAIVNWLLTSADYMAVSPDASGICQVRKATTSRSPVATFEDDEQSIMYPEVSTENDWQSTPNVVRAYYEDDTCAIYATAKNMSGSKASLDNRGNRELTLYESVSELDGADGASKLVNLKAYALNKLLDNSGEIERVSLSHPYVPILPNDAIQVRYGDFDWVGNVTNMRVSLAPSTKCDTETRRLVSPTIQTDVDGGILWEVSA